MQWKNLRWPAYMKGHKLFSAENGRIAIADWSGDNPEQTDDGVLWLDPSEPMRISLRRGTLCVVVPLLRDNGTNTATVTDIETAEVIRRLTEMPVELEGPELWQLGRVIADSVAAASA